MGGNVSSLKADGYESLGGASGAKKTKSWLAVNVSNTQRTVGKNGAHDVTDAPNEKTPFCAKMEKARWNAAWNAAVGPEVPADVKFDIGDDVIEEAGVQYKDGREKLIRSLGYSNLEALSPAVESTPAIDIISPTPSALEPQIANPGDSSWEGSVDEPTPFEKELSAALANHNRVCAVVGEPDEELLKFKATSSAVMLLAGLKTLTTGKAEEYYFGQDYTDGEPILQALTERGDGVFELAVKAHELRYGYTYLKVEQAVQAGIRQIVFLADGQCPQSIDIAAKYRHDGVTVFGCDKGNMQEKDEWATIRGMSNVGYTNCDVAAPQAAIMTLENQGLVLEKPILFVATGIFSYLPSAVARNWQEKINEIAHEHLEGDGRKIGHQILFDAAIIRPSSFLETRTQGICQQNTAAIREVFLGSVGINIGQDADEVDGGKEPPKIEDYIFGDPQNSKVLVSQAAEEELRYYNNLFGDDSTNPYFNESGNFGLATIVHRSFVPD